MSQKTFIPFNLNDTVRVRLTDVGRKIHRQNFRKLNSQIKVTAGLKYDPPKEDAEGWSEWQAWELFREFGGYVGPGQEPPFEIAVQIEQST